MIRLRVSEYLSQDRCVAGIFYIKVDSVANVIEKCFEAGVAVSLGGLRVAFGESGQKGKNLIRCNRFQISFAKFVVEARKQEIIVFYCIFFSN
jgi:hypothetical protein